MESLKPKDAAKLIGISYPTIKQWIYDGKIASVKTPGGHHRIPPAEVERLTGGKAALESASRIRISSRSAFAIAFWELSPKSSTEGLFSEVTIEVGGQQIVSIGMQVHALLKRPK
jgi:excisionase family DNA binding protein